MVDKLCEGMGDPLEATAAAWMGGERDRWGSCRASVEDGLGDGCGVFRQRMTGPGLEPL